MTQGLNPNGKLQTLKVDVDGALMVSGISGGGGGGGGTSNTTEATQLLVKAAVQSIDADIGTPADAAASSDTGTFSLIALIKRGLGNWTTLLGRIPALVGGRIPVDTSGAIQLGAGIVSATTQRVTLASDGPEVTNSTAMVTKLTSVDNKTPALVNGRKPVDTDRVVKQVIDAASAAVTYVCEASTVGTTTSAAGWRIKRITVSGTVTTIQWGGTGAFDQIADNRATTVVYA
jgi:hypothetical protein